MDLGIKGKTVLVTASSKGIGRAVAEAFIQEGCNVAVCSRSKETLLSAAAEMKKKYNVEPFWGICDINKPKDIENFVAAIEKNFNKIDILVNNCGGPAAGFFRDLKEEDWDTAFEQVLMSAVRFCNHVVPEMISAGWGRIINITSVSVKQPIDNLMLSNSLRSGVVGFAKSLSNEVAKHNITVNNVAPGYTMTHRLYDLAVHRAKQGSMSHEAVIAEYSKQVPMNRLAKPEEIADAVLFLASQRAGYITGNTIHVDGGLVKGIY